MLCTPQIELPITSPADRLKVGYIRIRVYDNQTALNGRFGNLLDRIPFKWSYPLGVLEDLFVGADKRRRGYGRLGLRLADEAFRNRHDEVCRIVAGSSLAAGDFSSIHNGAERTRTCRRGRRGCFGSVLNQVESGLMVREGG